MNGHRPDDPEWRQRYEEKLDRLVYHTEHGGMGISDGDGSDGLANLSAGDGSELETDDSDNRANNDDSASKSNTDKMRKFIEAGECSVESHGSMVMSDRIGIVEEWHQLMDVYGVKQYAKNRDGL